MPDSRAMQAMHPAMPRSLFFPLSLLKHGIMYIEHLYV